MAPTKAAKKPKKQDDKIPEYIDIPENLYKGSLQQYRYTDDVGSPCKCTLETGGCGANCVNRLLYMYAPSPS